MYVLTNEQMKKVDEETIDRICPGLELMERAGRGCTEVILHEVGEESHKAVVFCGPGNNGGDGLVIARYLGQVGWRVSVHLLKAPERFTPDAAKNYQRLREVMEKNAGVREFDATGPDWPEQALDDLADADIVVDAIFGTGVSGAPRDAALDMIMLINDCELPVFAIDIPSGVNGTTGDAPGEAVVASDTLTIGAPKVGTLFHPGKWHCGEVSVIDIGFPDDVIERYAANYHLLDRGEAASRLPYRAPDLHKFEAGTLVLLAGSAQYRGAALLAGEAALRSGCGMVYLGVPDVISADIDLALREVITVPLPSTGDGTTAPEAADVVLPYLRKADAVAVGPGMGRQEETDELIREIVTRTDCPTVIDADGITAFAGRPELLHSLETPIVITPHSGELARLLEAEVPETPVERMNHTSEVAARLGVTLLHKGAPSVIAGPDNGVWVNTTGSSALATGGTGDVLTGMVASLIAQGAEPMDAACVASWLHGRAGELAAEDMGTRGVIAGDLLWSMGEAVTELEALADD
jgi:NAD(P)H-hydrate epimerase